MKKELLKITIVSVGIYLAWCVLCFTAGLFSSAGSSPRVQMPEKEKYVFKAPAYRPLENGDELNIDTTKYENKRVVYLFAGNN